MELPDLKNLFAEHNIYPIPKQLDRFDHFLKIFIEKNSQVNLSAIRKEDDIVLKHFIDSLKVLNMQEYQKAHTVIDIGTGGGFPGLSLAIMSPDKDFTLMDSIGKKVKAVDEFVAALGLRNVKTITGRAEELAHRKEYREQFDLCVSRAVAFLPTLLEYSLPLVKAGGYCIAYKQESADEIDAARHMIDIVGGRLLDTFPYSLSGSDDKRVLLLFEKIRKTPPQYPRPTAIAQQKPL